MAKAVLAVLAALAVAVLIKLFLFDFIIAEGNSMEPTIRSGSVLIINKLQYGFRFPGQKRYLIQWAMPKQGDIVVFYMLDESIAVKRCSGITEKGEFTVKGDNIYQSFDSRSYGPIPANRIIGKVLGKK